ncbi:M28 family peptidase [Coleofasciculus sp. FACHB-T130]|uniref:M28 family peptidase n=1 Tax=Cyanophyceae TaxID=3028117 RepID=UPI001687AD13|nr:M28 family peptidase [Coleofasciculus sp. FACHB-T130]MBD1878154.1 M28 family peptidase [Coleofasciculus sp. FACHB-T130]
MARGGWIRWLVNRAALIRLAIIGILLGVAAWAWFTSIWMPGVSYQAALPLLTPQEETLRDALRQDVEKIAGELGEHNFSNYKNLAAAADFLEVSLSNAGYKVQRQGYKIAENTYYNLEAEIAGTNRADEIVVIGGHYDSVFGSPGANDNGTGAAAVLELARAFVGKKTSRTLRFVEFVNEEPPFFQTAEMGSVVYAKRCRNAGDNIVAMLSLETIGYYSDKPGTQKYPFPLSLFYPSQGNFIAFVSNPTSADLLRKAIASFRRHAKFPSEGAALPERIPGVGWSDQWSFWQQGYPGIIVTDTAPSRYPYYHTSQDTPDKIDYDRLARVVAGLEGVVADLAGSQ